MKGSQYFKQVQKVYTQENLNKAILSAALTVNADMSERIFVDGKASDGSDIGKYNTTDELYVNPKNAPKKFPTKGKEGDAKFSDGKPHKTGYFDSYAEFKKKVGRKVNKVNLVLFGILQSNWSNGVKPTERGASANLSEQNALKVEGQEEHWGKPIFKHTQEEIKKYQRLVISQMKVYAK